MNLKTVLLIHAMITFAAGIVLVISPTYIPQSVNIKITPNEFLLCYLLAGAEFTIAYLSFFSRKIFDKSALRIIVITFIVFHAASGVLELYALINGLSAKIIFNIVLRIVFIFLFYNYGIFKNK